MILKKFSFGLKSLEFARFTVGLKRFYFFYFQSYRFLAKLYMTDI